MRRLPFYFLVDTSTYAGTASPVRAQELLELFLAWLRCDPYALETAHLCVIKFGGETRVAMPLTDICSINLSEADLSFASGLGCGLKLLAQRLSSDLVTRSEGVAGDLKPTLFLLVESEPAGGFEVGLEQVVSFQSCNRYAFVSKAISEATIKCLKDSGFTVGFLDCGTRDSFDLLKEAVRTSSAWSEADLCDDE